MIQNELKMTILPLNLNNKHNAINNVLNGAVHVVLIAIKVKVYI